MIIKSMSRKEPSFAQLLAYVSRDASDQRYELRHNLMSRDMAAMTAEMELNAGFLPKRKNGVVVYHEILSITRSTRLSTDEQKEILRDIAQDYLRARAPSSLAFATLHQDKADQLHYHFVISANGVADVRRHRLSRAEFRKIQVDLEQRVLTLHPQLEQKRTIGNKKKVTQLADGGHQVLRKGQRLTKKERVAKTLRSVFAAAQSDADLFKRLTEARFELYVRGKSVGVREVALGTKYRLDTLGVGGAYADMVARIDALQTTIASTRDKASRIVPQIAVGTTAAQTRAKAIKVISPPPPVIAEPVLARELTAELLPNAIGAIATQATGSIEIAFATLGGPKVEPQGAPQQKSEPKPDREIKKDDTPPTFANETERLIWERSQDMEQLRQEQDRQHGRTETASVKR